MIIDVFERPNQSKVLPNGTMAKTSRPKLRLVRRIEMSEVFTIKTALKSIACIMISRTREYLDYGPHGLTIILNPSAGRFRVSFVEISF